MVSRLQTQLYNALIPGSFGAGSPVQFGNQANNQNTPTFGPSGPDFNNLMQKASGVPPNKLDLQA